MTERLKGRVAIITGGGSGQGLAAARLFTAEGAKAIIAEWREDTGLEAENELRSIGRNVTFIKTDVSSEKDVQAMVAKTVELYGTIDILFNNAGIGYSYNAQYKMADIVDTPLDDWNRIIAINLNGMFLCSKYVLPVMRAKKSGNIINNSSMNALVGESGADAYTAAKGGIVSLTRVMAKDNARYGIRVNCTCPGGVITPMIAEALETNPGLREHLEAGIPLGKLARAEDVANAALFFASDESSHLTGTILPVDGGWYAI
ncbi:short-chain dehydrogenase [Clostridia bacterium]|nr:short-chain dehydrogenase [Clostridia bacterium]GHU65843.1 short-chain dehydrogenase [Clostridia bacterium]